MLSCRDQRACKKDLPEKEPSLYDIMFLLSVHPYYAILCCLLCADPFVFMFVHIIRYAHVRWYYYYADVWCWYCRGPSSSAESLPILWDIYSCLFYSVLYVWFIIIIIIIMFRSILSHYFHVRPLLLLLLSLFFHYLLLLIRLPWDVLRAQPKVFVPALIMSVCSKSWEEVMKRERCACSRECTCSEEAREVPRECSPREALYRVPMPRVQSPQPPCTSCPVRECRVQKRVGEPSSLSTVQRERWDRYSKRCL